MMSMMKALTRKTGIFALVVLLFFGLVLGTALAVQDGNRPNSVEKNSATLAKMLHLDLKLSEARRIEMIGQRVYVRFFHGAEPLAGRLFRSLRQVFLKHFNV